MLLWIDWSRYAEVTKYNPSISPNPGFDCVSVALDYQNIWADRAIHFYFKISIVFISHSSLDLHHDIEVLKASLKESRQTVASLKNEVKLLADSKDEIEKQHHEELDDQQQKYERCVQRGFIYPDGYYSYSHSTSTAWTVNMLCHTREDCSLEKSRMPTEIYSSITQWFMEDWNIHSNVISPGLAADSSSLVTFRLFYQGTKEKQMMPVFTLASFGSGWHDTKGNGGKTGNTQYNAFMTYIDWLQTSTFTCPLL